MPSNKKKAVNTIYLSIFGNLGLAIIKGITGFFGNSYALIADAIESTTDIFSSILVLFGLKYSTKPADENHPYGHGRIEPLITFAIVGFLVISATVIIYQSIQHILTPHESPKGYTLVVLGLIILIKEFLFPVFYVLSNMTLCHITIHAIGKNYGKKNQSYFFIFY